MRIRIKIITRIIIWSDQTLQCPCQPVTSDKEVSVQHATLCCSTAGAVRFSESLNSADVTDGEGEEGGCAGQPVPLDQPWPSDSLWGRDASAEEREGNDGERGGVSLGQAGCTVFVLRVCLTLSELGRIGMLCLTAVAKDV